MAVHLQLVDQIDQKNQQRDQYIHIRCVMPNLWQKFNLPQNTEELHSAA